MAESRLRVIVETQDRQLSKLQGKLDKTDKAVEDLNGANKKLARSFRGVDGAAGKAANGIGKTGRAAQQASSGFKSLGRSLGKLALGFAAFQGVRSIGQIGIDSIEAERRLKALAGAFGEVQKVELAAGRAAEKFGLSQREANKAFAQIYARLRPIGIEVEQIESAFNGFNTAARLSGTSAQEASAAWLQLSQALGSGVLRGEELNSVFEQTPTVVQAIAKEMNAPIGKIRELAKEGKITSDVVLRALNRLEREGVDQLAEALNGPRQKFKDFSNSVEKLSNALATTVLPELSSAIASVGETILLLEGPIRFISGLLNNALSEANSLIRQFSKPAAFAAELDIKAGKNPASIVTALNPTQRDPFLGAKQLFGEEKFAQLKADADRYAKLRNQKARDVFVDLAQDALKALEGDSYIKSGLRDVPKPAQARIGDVVGGGSSGGGAAAAVDKTNQLLEQQNEAYNNIRQSQLRLITLNGNITELDKILLQNKFDYQDAVENINKTVAAGQRAELVGYEKLIQADKDRLATKEALEQDLANADAFGKIVQGVKPLNEELTQTQELLKGSFEIVSGELQNSIKGLIDGTQEWNEVLSNVLNILSSLLLNFAFKGLGSSLDIPGFANGGRPKPNQLSIVGEKGPELFVPDSAGTVIPNGAFGAGSAMGGGDSTVVNITINNEGNGSRSSSGSDAQEAARLGRLIERSTLAVINREKRPGGTLSS